MKKSNSSATSFARIFDRNREGTELLRSKHKKGNKAEVIVSFTDEEELPNCSMHGIYHITDGSIRGNWEVTFAIE